MELYNKEFVYFDWDDKLEGKKGFFSDDIYNLKQDVKDNDISFYKEIHHNIDTPSFPFQFIKDGSTCFFKFCYYDPYYEFRRAYLEGKQLQYKNGNGNWVDVVNEPLFKVDEYRIKPEMWYIVLDDYGLSRTNELSEDETVLLEGTEEECIEWMEKYRQFEKIMLAFRQGKTIQYKSNNEWEDWILSDIPRKGAFDVWKEWRIKDECIGCMKYDYCCDSNGIRCKSYCTKVEYVPFDTVEGFIDAWDSKYPQNKNRPEGTMPLIWIKNKEKNRVHLITDFYFEKRLGYDVGTNCEDFTLTELFEDFTFLDGSIIGKVKEE